MLAKRIKTKIRENRKITIYVPEMPAGDVEIIILREEENMIENKDKIKLLPKHKAGLILSDLKRDKIYNNAR